MRIRQGRRDYAQEAMQSRMRFEASMEAFVIAGASGGLPSVAEVSAPLHCDVLDSSSLFVRSREAVKDVEVDLPQLGPIRALELMQTAPQEAAGAPALALRALWGGHGDQTKTLVPPPLVADCFSLRGAAHCRPIEARAVQLPAEEGLPDMLMRCMTIEVPAEVNAKRESEAEIEEEQADFDITDGDAPASARFQWRKRRWRRNVRACACAMA